MEKERKTLSEKFKNMSKRTKTIWAVVIVVIVIIILSIIISSIIKRNERIALEKSNQRTVPDLVGMTFEQAKEEIEKLELEYIISPWKVPYDDDIIISQEPSADTIVTKGSDIEIELKTLVTEESNNTFGMCFKVTKEELSQKFLSGYDENLIDMGVIDNSFTYQGEQNGSKMYGLSLYKSASTPLGTGKEPYSILIALEDNNGQLLRVMCTIIDFNNQNSNLRQSSLESVYNMYESLLSINETEANSLVVRLSEKATNGEQPIIFDNQDSVLYQAESYTDNGSSYTRFSATAITEEKAKEIYGLGNDTSTGESNNSSMTNEMDTVETSSDIQESSTIKNGTYNKVLTSTEKDNGNISLGDINFEIKDNTIMFSDNNSQIVLEGTYTIENNKMVGTYTKATYYSYEQLDFVTETVEDPFEFEIKEDHTLYDTMGYGQFLGKCLQRNATYELVE